ncbi:MAG: VWA domain-containing protein, partial [Gammaproteobacteria bacterium]|nr:VWA domain-containing protein [Gammaproteobacteria bacterium]
MLGRKAGLLTPENEKLRVRLPDDMPLEWVVGFHHARVAKIDNIGWIDPVVSGENIDELTISVSLESPVGPWQPVATWSRTDSPTELTFAAPVWARYLKFSVAADAERPDVNLPETITIREVATADDYRSILGEWGVNSRSAYYESLQPVPLRQQLAQRGNETRSAADELEPGRPETGFVKLLEQSHWYRPRLPDAHNTLVLTIRGEPTVRTELELTTTSGDPVVLKKVERASRPDQHVFEAYVEPGAADLLLEVREPPRSVMFMWDTSPSIGRYRPMIYKSLLAYAEDLVPEVDTANLLPFGVASPLLDDWYGEPYLMQLILNDHARREGSSAAEHANAMATRALASRPGTKAIVTITDAETSAYPQMWDGMKTVQPRVFSMHVGPTAASQDLMQSWSSVNGGHYSHVIHENEMEIAFERAATMLRRPAKYTLALATETRDAPAPGFLRVLSGDTTPARGAVHLILDASGSMLQRMEGRRRIEIAKDVLTTAIKTQIPAGTPTALRVFGHRTPNACETDLEIPLAPLDTQSTIDKIADIQARNLARTPIAASLAAARQDLRSASGPSLIVLVTDGEETCEGDPAAVIASLRESGAEVSLNIVGFAIDDQGLAAEFAAWAEAGGGRYLAANDTQSLAESVDNALATTFRVFDSSGAIVADGRVDGDAVSLDQGNYRVVVDGGRSA